jgi:hypothetical protein
MPDAESPRIHDEKRTIGEVVISALSMDFVDFPANDRNFLGNQENLARCTVVLEYLGKKAIHP